MEHGKKVQPEPLSEQRWSRIERRLFERVANGEAEVQAPASTVQTRSRAPFAAVLVLAGAAAAAVGALGFRAIYVQPATSSVVAKTRVDTTTAPGASSHVSVGEASLDVAPESVVSVTGDDTNGVTVVLERGRVECDVPPRNGRPPFWVKAGEVSVRVVGTHFAVSRVDSSVDVAVQHGVVQVTAKGEQLDVHTGETWPHAPAISVAASAVPSANPSAQDAPVASVPPVAPIASVPPPSPRELYEAATRLEAARPDLAVARYRALAGKGGPWGMNALFAQGRLESERGHVTEARAALTDYLTRYPSGPNAGDARALLERLR
jgi:hypothetical protein